MRFILGYKAIVQKALLNVICRFKIKKLPAINRRQQKDFCATSVRVIFSFSKNFINRNKYKKQKSRK